MFSGWQAHVAATRKAIAADYRTRGAAFFSFPKENNSSIGALLWLHIRFIGDFRVDESTCRKTRRSIDASELRDAFPEADVLLLATGDGWTERLPIWPSN